MTNKQCAEISYNNHINATQDSAVLCMESGLNSRSSTAFHQILARISPFLSFFIFLHKHLLLISSTQDENEVTGLDGPSTVSHSHVLVRPCFYSGAEPWLYGQSTFRARMSTSSTSSFVFESWTTVADTFIMIFLLPSPNTSTSHTVQLLLKKKKITPILAKFALESFYLSIESQVQSKTCTCKCLSCAYSQKINVKARCLAFLI